MELVLLVLLFVYWTSNILHKLALLQQKDYTRKRIFIDRNVNRFHWQDTFLLIVMLTMLFPQVISIRIFQIALLIVICSVEIESFLFHKFKRPRITARIILIGFITGLLELSVVMVISGLLKVQLAYSIALVTVLSLYFMIIGHEFVRIFVNITHRRKMRITTKYLESCPNLKVIGITGSFGKSTVKGFLNTILSQSHKVISTPGSINTDIGLALSLNNQFSKLSQTEIKKLEFAVLEMDAYMVSTIKRVVSYFNLDLAIVTSINEQHLDTFDGKIQNTVLGNYQIFTGYKPDVPKIAIFNVENKYCLQMAEKFEKENANDSLPAKVYFYGNSGNSIKSDVEIKEVNSTAKPGKNQLQFNLKFSEQLGGQTLSIELPVLAEFNTKNYAAAALIAKILNVTDKDIIAAADQCLLKAHTLNLKLSDNKQIEIIDDTFNANPDGIKGFLELLSKRNQQLPCANLIIFTGLYDIGPNSSKIHQQLAPLLIANCDHLIITNPVWGDYIREGLSSKDQPKLSITNSVVEVKKIVHELTTQSSSNPKLRISLLNKLPSSIIDYIFSL